MTLRPLVLAALAAALASPLALAEDTVAVKAGKVYLGNGKTATNAWIVIKDGKIVDVTATAPRGAKTIDHGAHTIIPGLVAASSQMAVVSGADGANEESSEITPTFGIAGTLDPTHDDIRKALGRGITTACVRPGLRNVIGGFSAIVRPGATDGFVLNKRFDLIIPIGPWPASGNASPSWAGVGTPRARRPTTRMGTVWLIRKSFHDAKKYLETGQVAGLEKEAPGAYTKAELETLADAIRGKVTVRWFCRADKDVHTAFRLSKELGIKRFRFEGLLEGYRGPKALDSLEGGLITEVRQVNAINAVSPAPSLPFPVAALKAWFDTSHRGHQSACTLCPICARSGYAPGEGELEPTDPQYGARANNIAVLMGRGAKVAITTEEISPNLLAAARYAVRHGADPVKALAAITTVPAGLLGLTDVGRIAKGHRGDLVILSGDPFEFTTRILAVISGGKVVHPEGSQR